MVRSAMLNMAKRQSWAWAMMWRFMAHCSVDSAARRVVLCSCLAPGGSMGQVICYVADKVDKARQVL
jgi:hypothetical protein